MKKVYIEYGYGAYNQMFNRAGYEITNKPIEADLICFTGGSDVSPSLYGEKLHPFACCDMQRDLREKELFHEAVEIDIPMVGICRGGQFLNVMNGGKMFQHVDGHGGDHMLRDKETNKAILVSSTHHQMMREGPSSIIVATASEFGKKQSMPKIGEEGYDPIKLDVHTADIEVVYYPNTRSLCFQPHPEFLAAKYSDMTEYFFSLINRYIVRKEASSVA